MGYNKWNVFVLTASNPHAFGPGQGLNIAN